VHALPDLLGTRDIPTEELDHGRRLAQVNERSKFV
jgi:hypothetical protein